MRKQRLILLLSAAVAALAVIALRLAQLQLAEAKFWRAQAQSFSYRHYVLPTRRGPIVDCRGRYLAIQTPCYNLAIQYQAMNRDDRWITQEALRRLEKRYPSRRAVLEHLGAERRRIVAALRHLPEAISRYCTLPLADVLERLDLVRARMQLLQEDIWVQHYHRHEGLLDHASPTDLDAQLGLAGHVDLAEAHEAHTIVADISPGVAFYFQKHAREYPGLVIVPSTHRVYPFGATAAQVIGALRQVTPAALRKDPFQLPRLLANTLADTPGNLRGYLPGDEMGASGVESAAENLLRGTRGIQVLRLDGREILPDRRRPIPGQSVHLTLDIRLQQTLQRQLENPATGLLDFKGQWHSAAVVVLSVAHDNVLLMLSEPSFNLNYFHQDFSRLIHNPGRPLLNRAIAGIYPPGSVVKPLEAAFAITDGVLTPQTVIDCGAYLFPGQPNLFRNWTYPLAPGPLDLTGAIEQSCDTYFYHVGLWLGFQRMVAGYREFGLGQLTGVGLGDESRGRLPPAHGARDGVSNRTNAIFMSIGQGPLAVTPLQMANAYTTLLRGGIWMAPRLITEFPGPAPRRVPIDTAALPAIRLGMERVVRGPHGTAPILRMAMAVAGKTGTAQTVRRVRRNHHWTVVKGLDAWFIGYVPANHPQYVLAAVVPMGGDGGRRAGAVVRQCIWDMEHYGYLTKVDGP